MKSIIFIRHGEAGWGNFTIPDYERTLTETGMQEAIYIANKLKNINQSIDFIFCSSAKRTQQTINIIAHEIRYPFDAIKYDQLLYNAQISTLTSYIKSLDKDLDNIIIVGHNNGLSELIASLIGHQIGNMPTCGVCAIEFNCIHWDEFDYCSNTLKYYFHPIVSI
jgi:phosphohistidine phosphatase